MPRMTDQDERDFRQEFGAMKAEIRNLIDGNKRGWDHWAEMDRVATAGRRVLYRKIDELKEEQAELRAAQARLTAELAAALHEISELKPTVEHYRREKLIAQGKRGLMATIAAGAGIAMSAMAWMIHEVLQAFWGHH
jgi:hypothetical protein